MFVNYLKYMDQNIFMIDQKIIKSVHGHLNNLLLFHLEIYLKTDFLDLKKNFLIKKYHFLIFGEDIK